MRFSNKRQLSFSIFAFALLILVGGTLDSCSRKGSRADRKAREKAIKDSTINAGRISAVEDAESFLEGSEGTEPSPFDDGAMEIPSVADPVVIPIAVRKGITLCTFDSKVDYPNATLLQEKFEIDGYKVFNKFKVQNFELKQQTATGGDCHVANSVDGQHIHQIINRGAYTPRYTDTFSTVLEAGPYVQLCFLSKSYHESIKSKTAYQVRSFVVKNTGLNYEGAEKGPMLFHSRPKGTYAGKDAETILLDFYVVNGEKIPNYQVKLMVDDVEFMLTEWRAYALRGLKPGKHTITLMMTDLAGKAIANPWTMSKMDFIVAE